MKKFLAMLTFVAILSVSVVGCGDDKAKPKAGAGTNTSGSTAKPKTP